MQFPKAFHVEKCAQKPSSELEPGAIANAMECVEVADGVAFSISGSKVGVLVRIDPVADRSASLVHVDSREFGSFRRCEVSLHLAPQAMVPKDDNKPSGASALVEQSLAIHRFDKDRAEIVVEAAKLLAVLAAVGAKGHVSVRLGIVGDRLLVDTRTRQKAPIGEDEEEWFAFGLVAGSTVARFNEASVMPLSENPGDFAHRVAESYLRF